MIALSGSSVPVSNSQSNHTADTSPAVAPKAPLLTNTSVITPSHGQPIQQADPQNFWQVWGLTIIIVVLAGIATLAILLELKKKPKPQ